LLLGTRCEGRDAKELDEARVLPFGNESLGAPDVFDLEGRKGCQGGTCFVAADRLFADAGAHVAAPAGEVFGVQGHRHTGRDPELTPEILPLCPVALLFAEVVDLHGRASLSDRAGNRATGGSRAIPTLRARRCNGTAVDLVFDRVL